MKRKTNKLLKNIQLIIAGLALLLTSVLYGSDIVQVIPGGLDDFRRLQAAGLDIIPPSPGGFVQVVVSGERDYRKLDSLGMPYFVSLHDAEDYFAARLQVGAPPRDPMGAYKTFGEIVQTLNQLHNTYPDIVSEPFSIGNSLENRPLWMVRVSDNPEDDEDEPEALFTALIHAREPVTAEVLLQTINALARGYGQDEYLTHLVDERELYFLPCHNPDGYAFNERNNPNGGGMWRKNRRDNGGGSFGVDLNRNFGFSWGFDNIGSSPSPSDETYRGQAAFSEPETDAVRDFVNEHNITASLYYHSYSNLCFYPYGYNYLRPADQSALNAVARRMTAANHYWLGTPWEVIYTTNGGSDDWLYASDEHNPIFSFTIEVGTRDDYFWPPQNRIQPLVNENIPACLALAEYADRPQRALRPNRPFGVTAIQTQNRVRLQWQNEDDDFNPARAFRVRAQLPGQPFFDDGEQNTPRWERVNFSISQNDAHSGRSSYRAAIAQIIATMELTEEIPLPDTIFAWVNFNLRFDYGHGLACEISDDGFSWQPLPGLGVRNLVMNNQNLGPVMTGNSDGWQRVWWTVGNRTGEMLRFRFRHYQFSIRAQAEFCYIDDIGPLPGYAAQFIAGEDVEDLVFVDNWRGENYQYCLQAVDAEGDRSFWTEPVSIDAPEPDFRLRLRAGWSLISVSLESQPLQVRNIFAELIDDGILTRIKDGYGNFFSPAWDFDRLGDWNPLMGYQIHLTDSAAVGFFGEFAAVDTPIPLPVSWNSVAYLPAESIPAEQAFTSIADHLILAKDGWGRFWLVAEDFNNLGELARGNGYQLKIYPPDTLVYPAGDLVGSLRQNKPVDWIYPLEFVPPSPDNASILLKFDSPLQAGTLVIYDAEGLLSGCAVIEPGTSRVGLAAWGEGDNQSAGLKKGEAFRIALLLENGNEIPLNLVLLSGDKVYQNDGFAVFAAGFSAGYRPESNRLIAAYPNPFNSCIALAIQTAGILSGELEIYNSVGRRIIRHNLSGATSSPYHFNWNAEDYAAGVYIAQATIQGTGGLRSERMKLLLIR
ncbi:MAG: hypothetical protein FJY65_04585 [Calditrichaeota bacterium]|nr:hypothetical protein [Calditrichota bacterium]